MRKKLRILGAIFGLIGLGFVITGIVAYTRVQDGYDSLQAFSEAQNVTLSYNEDGQLTDRGTTEGADAILTLLEDRSPGIHDTLCPPCDRYSYQLQGAEEDHANCRDNFFAALSALDIVPSVVPTPWNLFMHTVVVDLSLIHI